MFPRVYFAGRYFAPRYWGAGLDTVPTPTPRARTFSIPAEARRLAVMD